MKAREPRESRPVAPRRKSFNVTQEFCSVVGLESRSGIREMRLSGNDRAKHDK